MMWRISPAYLAVWSVLVIGVLASDSGSTTERQCHGSESDVACSLITVRDNKTHYKKECDGNEECSYHTTCLLNGTAMDLYLCSNENRTRPATGRQKVREDTSGGKHSQQVVENKIKVSEKSSSTAYKMPYLFQRIIQRHRSYNANAFNKGTYFLNGRSYVNKEIVESSPTPLPPNVTKAGT